MTVCPYCFENCTVDDMQCPQCRQYIIDDLIHFDTPLLDKKGCLFCGKPILVQAKFCKYCRKWLDEVTDAANDIDPDDLV